MFFCRLIKAPAPGKKKTAASWLRKGGSAAGRDAEAEEADGGNGASEIKREKEREEKLVSYRSLVFHELLSQEEILSMEKVGLLGCYKNTDALDWSDIGMNPLLSYEKDRQCFERTKSQSVAGQ
ncbi:hypothetical protein V1477_012819 [Vespula maculifrons]|uniref:Uncharacterized protein n=1 Tax=Vespula maculifrons TaxID=7453 RepID=A0ABD2BU52_VESMC